MSHILDIPFGNGYVSTGTGARDAASLQSGELAKMEAAYYRKNDPTQVWKMPGRALFGSAGATAVKGIAICQFDTGGTDKLVASIGTTLLAATPGATGTFASLVTGLNASATRFTACSQDDRWYLGNGYDKNSVLKSDGTVSNMGMFSPQTPLTWTSAAEGAGATLYPNANTGGFTNPTNAYDSDDETFAYGTRSTAGTITHSWTWAASTAGTSRTLSTKWAVAGFQKPVEPGTESVGTGGSLSSGFHVTVLVEAFNLDGASTWRTIASSILISPTLQTQNLAVTDGVDLATITVRATMTYNSGSNPATLRIYFTRSTYGSTLSNFDETAGFYYAYTEYDGPNDRESPPSDFSKIVTFTAKNAITLTRPATVNTTATEWRIYRTVSGATNTLDSLGKILASGDINSLTYVDRFVEDTSGAVAVTIQLTPTIPVMTVGDLVIPRDSPPPAFISMISWNGSIVGISRTDRRTLRYSQAGRPESFPEFYVVSSFPLDEHDGLVGQMAVGETLVLLLEGAVLALEDLPRVVDGQFNGASARPLKGHPGCVGEYAYTAWSVAGEPRGAWVSPYGVYVTNGQVCACISTDLAWENEVNVSFLGSSVLRWDAKNLILWFEFDLDGDGLNDHEMPFHMAQAHSKGESRPKLGQPTSKATSCMASALIASTHYRFSGHPSNGGVYVEESGTVDAATGVTVEMVVRSGQIAKDKVDLAVVKATVNHSNFGTGETGTLTATLYRDAANTENSKEQSVRLDGNRGTTVGIGRSGELVDFEVSYSGTGSGGIGGVTIELDGQGRSGSATRWVSASATP